MVWWEILLIVLGCILLILGIIGSVAPVLPGPPLSWIALLCLEFTNYYDINIWILVITGIVMIIITALDYWIPAAGTKYFGGSRYGVWGSVIGIIASLIMFPVMNIFGIILFPFLGALVGELIAEKPFDKSLKAAFGSLLGFLAGTVIKLIYSVVLLVMYIVLLFL